MGWIGRRSRRRSQRSVRARRRRRRPSAVGRLSRSERCSTCASGRQSSWLLASASGNSCWPLGGSRRTSLFAGMPICTALIGTEAGRGTWIPDSGPPRCKCSMARTLPPQSVAGSRRCSSGGGRRSRCANVRWPKQRRLPRTASTQSTWLVSKSTAGCLRSSARTKSATALARFGSRTRRWLQSVVLGRSAARGRRLGRSRSTTAPWRTTRG
mmetsp:Transcript_13485/g.43064  ORF Transcript_13485/g.43064 Transcript_13485/m.43064 type:complete len:212 (-) Transcript_13485:394-1029(-)